MFLVGSVPNVLQGARAGHGCQTIEYMMNPFLTARAIGTTAIIPPLCADVFGWIRS